MKSKFPKVSAQLLPLHKYQTGSITNWSLLPMVIPCISHIYIKMV